MGIFGAFQVNAFQNDAFQVNDALVEFAPACPVWKFRSGGKDNQQEDVLSGLPTTQAVSWCPDSAVPSPLKIASPFPQNDLVLPAVLLSSLLPWSPDTSALSRAR